MRKSINFPLIIFALLLNITFIIGQENNPNQTLYPHTCGTGACSPARQAFLMEIYGAELAENTPVRNFKVKVHIVQDTNGYSRINDSLVISSIANLNESFREAHMQFSLLPVINKVQSNYVLNELRREVQKENELTANIDVQGVINIYIVRSNNALQGYTPTLSEHFEQYEEAGLDKIFIGSRAFANNATLQHELGHFFSLHHTYGDSPVEGSTLELPDGSNCRTTGDFICDTPADPNGQLDCCTCEYLGTIHPSEKRFNPRISNFMSYYKYCCRNAFTPGQLAVMYNFAIRYRGYLK